MQILVSIPNRVTFSFRDHRWPISNCSVHSWYIAQETNQMLLRWLTHRNKAKWGRNIYEGAFCCFLELKITNMYTRLYSHWSLSRTRQIWKILRPLPPIYLHWVFWKVWNSPVWNIQFDELNFFPSLKTNWLFLPVQTVFFSKFLS